MSGKSISDAIDRALDCLRVNFRSGNNEAGWYHFLDDPTPGITASAVGLFTFRLAGQEFERSDEIIRYLVSQQVDGPSGAGGGWAVRTTNGFPIIEATAWVVRALSTPGLGRLEAVKALQSGANFLVNNQNTDFGWASYAGQPSRVFHTALCMLALQECGGPAVVIDNAKKWLLSAQSPDAPAWGALPGTAPTLLHTSMALLALTGLDGALSVNTVKKTADWILERLTPGTHAERSSTVEEFDVPVPGDHPFVFQNILPHFAGPIAVTALLAAGVDPLQPKLFTAVSQILRDQQKTGTWELPRSPLRESIWAIWPFVSALARMREAVFPVAAGEAQLLYPGCALVQTHTSARKLTTALLMRNFLLSWVARHKIALALWIIGVSYSIGALVLYLTGAVDRTEFLIGLILPAVLLVFQLVWGARVKRRDGSDS
ncbi:prenyltransferase/squalene oxidase repeat-containing protein [Micromonospora sp. NPDC050686]|uniref:prenyltransferase/squalene oxidase repeat-containing protein n=1 Tax=Micromonospora sp. NPDC050686 TaxID=3154631 RepID=UPI0033D6125E